MSMLDNIMVKARADLQRRVSETSLEELKAAIARRKAPSVQLLRDACARRGPLLLTELKRRSPSSGVINTKTPADHIVSAYLSGGVDCLSVVTDAPSFGGSLAELRSAVRLADAQAVPVIRKDFIIDEYGIAETAAAGAAGALILVRALGAATAAQLVAACWGYGVGAVIEVADAADVAAAAGLEADIILVNARDLRTGATSLATFSELISQIRTDHKHTPVIAASGITAPADAQQLIAQGANGVLVGTTLMRSDNRAELIRALRTALETA